MQTVSAGWKSAQVQTIVPESYVEVSYKISDPAAEADASATDNGHWEHSDTGQVVDLMEKSYNKYATLEHNMWALDGSFPILPDMVTQDTGFVSSVLSGSDGTFAVHPIITISFTEVHSNVIPGITIKWSEAFGECARDFVITAYNGTTASVSRTVTDNTDIISTVETDIDEYDKITIEIAKWCLPSRRTRIEAVIVGIEKIFGKNELMGYEHSQFADMLSLGLPKSQIVFSVGNIDGAWNPDNPSGIWKYLIERQEVAVRYGYKIGSSVEWIKAGTFYMSEWDTPANGITASFTARDMLEFMQGKFTATSGTYTLTALATQALTQAALPTYPDGTVRWTLASALSSTSVTIDSADFDHTIAEVLQLCANAACCVLYQDRDGRLNIKPLPTTLTDYLVDEFVSYANAEYEISKELNSVDVNDGQGIVPNAIAGEVQKIKNPLIQDATRANAVATWVKNCLKNRKTLSGDYRADPRLDALDKVTVKNKYAQSPVYITSIKYSYNGAFRGSYEGRVMAQ